MKTKSCDWAVRIQSNLDLKLMLCRRERDFFSDQHSLSIIIIFIEEYQASDKILFGLVNDFLKKRLDQWSNDRLS